jgi:small-conductance mechanosensitive channel
MLFDGRLSSLSEIITKQQIFLGRADVQHQFLAIACSLLVARFLSHRLWAWIKNNYPQATTFTWRDERLPPRQYLAALVRYLNFSVISLIILLLNHHLFALQNWTKGLLSFAIEMLWAFFSYCFFLVSLYAVFPLAIVRKYRIRLLSPLFILFVLQSFINFYSSLEQIFQTFLFKLFNTPITFKSLFLLMAGLYFWTVIVILLEDILLNVLRARASWEVGVAEASLLLTRYFLIALGIVIILGYVGVNGTALAAVGGGLSIGLGFGLQQVVSNFISGILLLFEGILKPGDIISVEGQTSEVKKLGIRATTVRMLVDNSEKIIPNQTFITSDVTTFTGSNCLVNCSIPIGVGYDSNPQQVMNLLLGIAQENPNVLQSPSPSAFFIGFGDSSLNFELKFWLDNINIRKRVISDLSCTILEKFTEQKIEIPFPQREIHIRSELRNELHSEPLDDRQ